MSCYVGKTSGHLGIDILYITSKNVSWGPADAEKMVIQNSAYFIVSNLLNTCSWIATSEVCQHMNWKFTTGSPQLHLITQPSQSWA